MNKQKTSILLTSLCSCVLSAESFSEKSSSYQSSIIEEVLVTARKREESLQETPVAISAFSSESLRAANIKSIGRLAKEVPGLTMSEESKSSGMSIRGVGTRAAGSLRVDPGVGVYVDSIYIPRADTQILDVINMESIQVLRGPQGTLFGKNNAGGALLFTTKKPSDELDGFLDVDVGDLSRNIIRAGVSGPLSQEFNAGIIVSRSKESGYMRDIETGTDYGNKNKKSLLTQIRYMPNQDLTADLMIFLDKQEERTAPSTCLLASTNAKLVGFSAPGESRNYIDLCRYSESLAEDNKVIHDRSPQPWETESQLMGLTVNWSFEEIVIKSITGYLHQDDVLRNSDQDATPLFSIQNKSETVRQLNANGLKGDGEKRTFISQEFEVSGEALTGLVDYTVGVFASIENIDNAVEGQVIGPGGFLGERSEGNGFFGSSVLVLPPRLAGLLGVNIAEYENKTAAIFGQGIFHLSESWHFTLGGRYTWENKNAKQDNYVTNHPGFGLISEDEFDALENFIQPIELDDEKPFDKGSEEWSEFTPSVSLAYTAPDYWLNDSIFNSLMSYISASKGFKAGGFSPIGDEFVVFEPETLWNYELGLKVDLFDHKLRVNGAIYQSDYNDIQLQVTRELSGVSVATGVTNASEADIQGAELEFTLIPFDGLELGFTASYIDAEYKDFIDSFHNSSGDFVVVDRSDEPFAFIPEQSYSWFIQYEWLGYLGSLTPRLSGSYTDDVYIGLDQNAAESELSTINEYVVWNARVAWRPDVINGIQISIYVNNLTDNRYFGGGNIEYSNQGSASMQLARPRSYGMNIFYQWE